ncbi:MAG: hypothetical protein J07HN4v3_02033 [Halonotius sp. J07HN4]|jgi:hypothetical protein|nr:MAG: hypothetical protein J07HN4v3_02033 [Halonotius sp. J07HN4]
MTVAELLTDPVLIGILAVLLLFVFFGYLLVRRTVLGLREGYRDGQRRE